MSSTHLAVLKLEPAKSSVNNTCGTATTSTANGAITQLAGVVVISNVVVPKPTGVTVMVCVFGAPAAKFKFSVPPDAPAGIATAGLRLSTDTEAGAASLSN